MKIPNLAELLTEGDLNPICPFCGEDRTGLYHFNHPERHNLYRAKVECNNPSCGATVYGIEDYCPSISVAEHFAIKAWNRRAMTP